MTKPLSLSKAILATDNNYPLASIEVGIAMDKIFKIIGPNEMVQLFGVKLVGVNATNGKRLLFSIVFILLVVLLGRLLRWLAAPTWDTTGKRFAFWTQSRHFNNGHHTAGGRPGVTMV